MTRPRGIALSEGAGTRLYRCPDSQEAAAAGLQQAVVCCPPDDADAGGLAPHSDRQSKPSFRQAFGTARRGASRSEWPERSNRMELWRKSHLLGLLDGILAPRTEPKTATVRPPPRRRGLGYRTIQRGLRRSVQTRS